MRTRNACLGCAIRSDALCGVVPIEQLSLLNRAVHRKRYRPRSVIVGSGDKPDWYAYAVPGVIKLTKALSDGRQQIVGLLCGPPEWWRRQAAGP
jgi:CRP/FNR family transcriptional regulator